MQLVLYQPPPHPMRPDTAAGAAADAAAVLHISPAVLQQHVQQPNALAALWRSLTPGQRRSLAGMWDALRDQKMLAGMLRKLPAQDGADDAAKAEDQQQQQRNACVIEELSEGDDNQGQHMPAAAASAVQPLSWAQQQALPGASLPAAAGDSMLVDVGSELQQQQEQQLDDGCGMDLD
jgi:hypothetical protein